MTKLPLSSSCLISLEIQFFKNETQEKKPNSFMDEPVTPDCGVSEAKLIYFITNLVQRPNS